MRPALVLLLLLSCVPSCKGSGGGAAILGSAVAVGVSVARRAGGECYTPCTTGTACNETNGLCEPLPCRARCTMLERCDLLTDRCVPNIPADIAIDDDSPGRAPPPP